MIGAEVGFHELDHLLLKWQGQVEPLVEVVGPAEVGHVPERGRSAGPSVAFATLSVFSKSGRDRSNLSASR